MSCSDIIQLVSILIALLTSSVSIAMQAVSSRKAAKAEFESSRAHLSMKIETFDFGGLVYYISIKNYGKSPAQLLNILYPETIKQPKDSEFSLSSVFECNKNVTVSPGETILSPFLPTGLPVDPFTVSYTYLTLGKKFTDCVSLSYSLAHRNCKFRRASAVNQETAHEKNISFSLQEIAERISTI